MMAIICAKRLGAKVSSDKASRLLLDDLAEQKIPPHFAARSDLWEKAYETVGTGIKGCPGSQ
jgi:hypothetical protein